MSLVLTHFRYQFTETVRVPMAVIGTTFFPALSMLFFVFSSSVADDPLAASSAVGQLGMFSVMVTCLFSFGVGGCRGPSPAVGPLPANPACRRGTADHREAARVAFILLGLIPIVVLADSDERPQCRGRRCPCASSEWGMPADRWIMRTGHRTAALTALALALAACNSTAGTATTPEGASPTAGLPTTAVVPATVPASTGSPSPSGTPAGSVVTPECRSAGLTVSLGPPDGAAGSVYRVLVFTNNGGSGCELQGFPGVSYVAGDGGQQVGPAAERVGDPGGSVRIAPGGTASAQLQLGNVANYDAAPCRPTPRSSWRTATVSSAVRLR